MNSRRLIASSEAQDNGIVSVQITHLKGCYVRFVP